MIYLIPLALIVFFLLLNFALAANSLIIWLPTKKLDLARVFALADLKPGEIFFDLGSGDGRVAFYFAERLPNRIVGLEMAWPLYLISKLRQWTMRNLTIDFKRGDLFKENLSGAQVVYVFGIPEKLQHRLRPKLEQELRAGARVISYAFPIRGWSPSIIDKTSIKNPTLYLYRMPCNNQII